MVAIVSHKTPIIVATAAGGAAVITTVALVRGGARLSPAVTICITQCPSVRNTITLLVLAC